MTLQDFITPELIVLIPVLFVLKNICLQMHIPLKTTRMLILAAGIVLSLIWMLSITEATGLRSAAKILFSGVTQGTLLTGIEEHILKVRIETMGKSDSENSKEKAKKALGNASQSGRGDIQENDTVSQEPEKDLESLK